MEFRRIEVKKILRYKEDIISDEDNLKILNILLKNSYKFSLRLSGMNIMTECYILAIKDTNVDFYVKSKNLKITRPFADIELLEIESNVPLVSEADDGGRWSKLVIGA